MAETRTVFTASSAFCCLLLLLSQLTSTNALCSANQDVEFWENNTENALVTVITVEENVVLRFSPAPANPDNPFILDGNELRAREILDYEANSKTFYSVDIICVDEVGGGESPLNIIVLLKNINDNPPVYEFSSYSATISEVNAVGTVVGRYPAEDLDDQQLTYTLTPEDSGFRLASASNPEILVNTRLDYDTVKNVQLVLTAQDTPLVGDEDSYSATTTININIVDGDNRPPWFQPCTLHSVGLDKVCVSDGYTGWVVLNEQQTEPLALKPGALFAIDGDSGINEAIRYSFLSGNEDSLFEINPTTGNITMLKPADVVDNITLTVLAAQETNSHQFATTTVTISVQVKSIHPPQFERPLYEGVITSVGGLALNVADMGNPLHIVATDDDYLVVGGINPHITYAIVGSDAFIISNNFLFMTRNIPDTTLTLQVTATDTTNDQLATSDLIVEVKAASGGYSASDMAALGATLGALLLISLLVIGLLICRMRKGEADSKKIYEASVFVSSLRQDGLKDGIQYTNQAFQHHDEDRRDSGPGFPSKTLTLAPPEPMKPSWSDPSNDMVLRAAAPLRDLLQHDASDTSDAGVDKMDSEKEVKPILTKERRQEDGYKSVWFKEDIDPNAKEEVVIIPDSGEHDSDDNDHVDQGKTSRVMFADSDMDSGLGVKDSDSDSDQNIHL